MELEFSLQILEKNNQIYNLMQILPCGRMDRPTDMTQLIITFRNFTKASSKSVVKSEALVCLLHTKHEVKLTVCKL